jgi:hypothetical protein
MTSCGLVAIGLQKQVLAPLTLGQHMSGYIVVTGCARLRCCYQTVTPYVLPDVTPCTLRERDQHFGVACCSCLLGRRSYQEVEGTKLPRMLFIYQTTWCYLPED